MNDIALTSDCWLVIASLLDDVTLERVAQTPLWLIVREFAGSQVFWKRRVETLITCELEPRPEERDSWMEVYRYFDTLIATVGDEDESDVESTDDFCDVELLSAQTRERYEACASITSELTLLVLLEVQFIASDWCGDYPIRIAAVNGYARAVAGLLEVEGVDPTAEGHISLLYAARNGHTEVVRLLLRDGRSDPDERDSYALVSACKYEHVEIVRLLLRDGRADPTARNCKALRRARSGENNEVFRLLCSDSRVRAHPDFCDLSSSEIRLMRRVAVVGVLMGMTASSLVFGV